MKNFRKILIGICILLGIYLTDSHAAIVEIPQNGINKITEVSISKAGSGDIIKDVNSLGFSILRILKVVLQGVLLIYIVYIGVTMIVSMGTDDDKLSKSKNQLWYSLIALVFINIPGTIYTAINNDNRGAIDDGTINATDFSATDKNSNIFVKLDLFSGENGVMSQIISFMEVFIFGVALFILIAAGIKIMTSRGRDDSISEAKNKILYSIFAMIFVGFVEAWKQLAITGDLNFGTSLFGKMTDVALLFAGPIVIIFLSLAGYYYITSNGDEEKTKKAKSIIINTMIAILLLVVMVTFLNDLITL